MEILWLGTLVIQFDIWWSQIRQIRTSQRNGRLTPKRRAKDHIIKVPDISTDVAGILNKTFTTISIITITITITITLQMDKLSSRPSWLNQTLTKSEVCSKGRHEHKSKNTDCLWDLVVGHDKWAVGVDCAPGGTWTNLFSWGQPSSSPTSSP